MVDLWAPWCGPCRTLGPILEKVTDATDGQVVLVEGQRRREPPDRDRLPGAVDPRGVRAQGRPGRRRVRRRLPGGRRARSSCRRCCRPRPSRTMARAARRRRRGQPPPGARARARQTRRSVALAELLVDDAGTTRRWRCSPGCPRPSRSGCGGAGPPGRRRRRAASTNGADGRRRTTTTRSSMRCSAGARRRGGAAGVRRHPRGDGARGPPHGALPPPADQPPVLERVVVVRRRSRTHRVDLAGNASCETISRQNPLAARRRWGALRFGACGWSDARGTGCSSAVRCRRGRTPSPSDR